MIRLLATVTAMALIPATAIGADAASADSIRQWIEDLDDDRFDVREQASENLTAAGKEVIAPLQAAALGGSMEAGFRALRILVRLAEREGPAIGDPAMEALKEIAKVPERAAGRRAASIVDGWKKARQAKIYAQIRELGGSILQQSDGVTMVKLGSDWKGGHRGVDLVQQLPELRSLSFEQSTLDDDALKRLEGLTNLNRLYLGESKIQGKKFALLKSLTGLDYLSLKDMKIDDEALEPVGEMTHLAHLGLDGTPVGDAAMAHVKKLVKLQRLWLSGTNVTDAGLAQLKDLKELNRLEVPETKIDGTGLAHLKDLPKLTYLVLNDVKLSDAGWQALATLARLETIELKNTSTTDADLLRLHNFESLKRVYLSGTQVTDEGVAALKKALPRCSVSK
ncbi:MAG: hypothetical protein HQ567_22010 [Candidatus Nealsonbacteria bacterium]|nr:hypothetical protein [Candidatus Nealsonbacteria bacterium]